MTHFNSAFQTLQMLTSSYSQNGTDHMTKRQEQTFAPPSHGGYLAAAGETIFIQTCAVIFCVIAPSSSFPKKAAVQ